jgi:hypothetical protein
LSEEAPRPRPVGHKIRNFLLGKLGATLFTRFNQRGDVNDINTTISLQHEAPTLRPPGTPVRATTLNNLATLLKTRYDNLDTSDELFVSLTCFHVKGIWL